MMIESNYWINISKLMNDSRYHFFGNVELRCSFEHEAIEKYEILKEKFPKGEGWNLELNYTKCSGRIIARSN